MKRFFCSLLLGFALVLFVPPSLQGVIALTVGNDNPTGPTGEFNGSIITAGSYDPYTGNAKRFIDDLTVAGSVGAYPLRWTRILNTRGGAGFFGESGGWKHSYQWTLSIQQPIIGNPPPCVPEVPDATVAYPDGRTLYFRRGESPGLPPRFDEVIQVEPAGDRLVKVGGGDYSAGDYDFKLKDGGRVEFRHIQGGFLAATAIVDPFGQRTYLEYYPGTRLLWRVREPAGRYLEIAYEWHTYETQINIIPPLYATITLINNVQAFDRLGGQLTQTVHYNYVFDHVQQDANSSNGGLYARFYKLTQVDYDEGPPATYLYDPPKRDPNAFSFFDPARVHICNDVRFNGPMSHIEYEYVVRGTDVANPGRGQVKAEKNSTTHQAISEMTYPAGSYYGPGDLLAWGARTETRLDGATRFFQYNENLNGVLGSYTDFAFPGEAHNTTRTILDRGNDGDAPYTYTVIDSLNHATVTTKEPNIGAVLSVQRNSGPSTTYHYTSTTDPYYLESVTDQRGKITSYTRYPNHQIEYVYYPDGGYEHFAYNNFGQVVDHTMTSQGVEHFEYDNRGLKTKSWPPQTDSDMSPADHKTQYFYYGGPGGPGEGINNVPNRPDLIDRLWRVIDPRGNNTWYDYNKRGQVTRVTHDDGTHIIDTYYPDGTLESVTDELAHTTHYVYDEYKRLTHVTNHLGEIVKTSYDPNHEIGPDRSLSHTTSSIYRVTSHLQRKTDNYYDANFRPKLTRQASGTQDQADTKFTYDTTGKLETVEDPRGKVTRYGYDDRNRQTSVQNVELNETTEFQYDDANNKTLERRADGALRTWDYDDVNRLWHVYDWRRNETPTLYHTTTYDRDYAGNPQYIKDTKGAVYRFTYDKLNRKESATNPSDDNIPARTENWRYDPAGNLIKYTNPDGQQRNFAYDNRNRQFHSWWTGGTANGQDIVTSYDGASRVTKVVTNDNYGSPITAVAFGYDDANRKIWEDQTLAGHPTRRVNTDLDGDGKRTNLQLIEPPADGADLIFGLEMSGSGTLSVTYDYTFRNQLKTITGSGAEQWSFNYIYDASGNLTTRRADYNGRSSSTTVPEDAYDALNRPGRWEQTAPNGFHALSHYQYDRGNREKAVSREEDGFRGDRFEYEDTNQLKKVSYGIGVSPTPPPGPTPPNPTPTPPSGTPTPPGGTPTPPPGQQAAMPAFNPPGQDYYPLASLPITLTTATSGAQIRYTTDYTSPTDGGIVVSSGTTINTGIHGDVYLRAIAFKDGMSDSEENAASYVWGGNGINSAGTTSRVVTYAYTPDKLNRDTVSDNGVVTTYAHNALNQYKNTANTFFEYDNNFNLKRTTGYDGIFDAANRLISASNDNSGLQQMVAEFVYDGLGRCVKRTFNGVATILIYDGWKPIAEFDAWDRFQAWNVYGPGPDEILLRQRGEDGYIRFGLDRHGNVAFLFDNDGVIREKYTYDVFGRPKITGPSGDLRGASWYGHSFFFQGREYIPEIGIYDYRNRFYLPALGRFLQTDPVGLQTQGEKLTIGQKAFFATGAQAPDTFANSELNLYRYCGDDPVDLSDPLGLEPVTVGEFADQAAQVANQANRDATLKTNNWPKEFGTAVNADSSGNLTLNGPISNSPFQVYVLMNNSVPFALFVSGQTILVTHSHTNEDDRDTKSHLSTGDIKAGNISGKPIYVITPNGEQDRYRPSNKESVKERFNDPGLIERLTNGKWVPVSGANPDIRNKPNIEKFWR
jgi:RHS repeat-associated protein